MVLEAGGKVPVHVGLALLGLGREAGREYTQSGLLGKSTGATIRAILQDARSAEQARYRQILSRYLDAQQDQPTA